MGTLVNGIKEIFATSQTTATHLPVCASDGTPQGRISVGDLASVLGVASIGQDVTGDFDNAPRGLRYVNANSGTPHAPANLSEYRGWIYTTHLKLASNAYRTQIYSDTQVKRTWQRFASYDSVWTDWKEIAYDIPTFYKNYSTIQSLARNVFSSTATSYTLNENETVVVDSSHRVSNNDSHIYFIGYDALGRCGMVSVVGATVSYIVKPTNWDNFFTISCDSGGVKVTRTSTVTTFAIQRFL